MINFDGNYQNAHTVADIGGDVITLYRHQQAHINPIFEWYALVKIIRFFVRVAQINVNYTRYIIGTYLSKT